MSRTRPFILLLLPLILSVLALAPAAAANDASEASADRPALALDGLDPVALIEGLEIEGREDLSTVDGRFEYRFASKKNRRRFEQDPQRWGIQLDGQCAKMGSLPGNPSHFAVVEEQLYIFGSDECREDFVADPEAYLPASDKVAVRQVAIVVFEGVELLDFAGPGEVFKAAGGFEAFDVSTVAATRDPIVSQGFVTVVPGRAMAKDYRPDIVVIPGGGVSSLLRDEAAMAWLDDVAADADIVLSVCNGAHALAKLGLLDGLEATTHRSALENLRRNAPNTVVHDDRRFVDNGKIVTSAGVSAGIDASLHLVERLLGAAAARRTASYMEYDWRPERFTDARSAKNVADAAEQ